MSVTTTGTKVTLQGNGVTTVWPYSFLIPNANNVVITTVVNGVSTVIPPSNYTITGIGTQGGGSVTYPTAGLPLATGSTITIQRLTPRTQPTTLANQANFYPAAVEGAIDNVEVQAQEIATSIQYSLQQPLTDSVAMNPLPSAASRANGVLGFDVNGNPLMYTPGAATPLIASSITVTAGANDPSTNLQTRLTDLNSAVGATFVGHTPPGTGAVATTVGAFLGAFHQYPSGFFYSQSGSFVNRVNDRLFIGDATVHDGRGPGTLTPDWLTTWQTGLGIAYGSMASAQSAVLGTQAAEAVTDVLGFLAGVQTIYATSAAASPVGIESIAINNNATYATSVWAHYAEAHRFNNTVGSTIVAEFDPTQRGAAITINPYQQNFGQTVGVQLASGAQQGAIVTGTTATNVLTITSVNQAADIGLIQVGWKVTGVGIAAGTTISSFGTGTGGTGTYNLSTTPGTLGSRIFSVSPMFDNTVAINIQANPNAWTTGINFAASSLTGTDGASGGVGTAIAFAQGHAMIWYAPGGVSTGYVYSNASANIGAIGILLGQGSAQFIEASTSKTNFQVNSVVSGVNYPYVAAATTGNSVTIGALGGDANVDLGIFCAGTGLVKFSGTSMAAANGSVATVLGSLGPAGSHTTVQEWLTFKNASGVQRWVPCF